jgi:membrane-bound lytic murein transglycosylase
MEKCAYIIKNNYPKLAKNSTFNVKKLFTKKARKTLEFMYWSIKNDFKNKRNCRILNPRFLNNHFTFLKWLPDHDTAKKKKVNLHNKKKIRTTKYAIFSTKGSAKKSKQFPHALYTFKHEKDADAIRFKFTKQQIIAGALERKPYREKVKPLVWLSRNGLEEALMQGTILVYMPDKKQILFTVDKNNGIAYDQRIKNSWNQKRYWYFKKITENKNNLSQSYVINHPGITLAGDIYNIGLGKIIALRYRNPVTKQRVIRLGVLCDTGGAFVNNLYQLDLFAGTFPNREALFAQTRDFPTQAEAYVMIKK